VQSNNGCKSSQHASVISRQTTCQLHKQTTRLHAKREVIAYLHLRKTYITTHVLSAHSLSRVVDRGDEEHVPFSFKMQVTVSPGNVEKMSG
jgi:hypothetical protein